MEDRELVAVVAMAPVLIARLGMLRLGRSEYYDVHAVEFELTGKVCEM